VLVAGFRRADLGAIGLEQARRSNGAEQALSASQRDLKVTIDTIPALVWSTRADGSVDFVNQHYLDYVELSPEQVKDWGWTAAVHPDDLSGLTAIWRSLIASGKSGRRRRGFVEPTANTIGNFYAPTPCMMTGSAREIDLAGAAPSVGDPRGI
jgi:PAS domain-containing protein